MAREIPLDQIGNYMDGQIQQLVKVTTLEWTKRVKKATPVFSLSNYSQAELDAMPNFFTLPNGKVAPLKKALLERPTGGQLRDSWQAEIQPYRGEVTTNVVYAVPVCYGINLPQSWKGKFRTRQDIVPGFPTLIGKELESWAQREYQKIIRRG
tara:strand:+ start:1316 stop:1774 length:459 start_codon:yes stop_codon:yes gene_type:complete